MTELGISKRQAFYKRENGIGEKLMPFLHSREVEKFIDMWYYFIDRKVVVLCI